MTNVLSLQRILLALGVIVFVGAAAVGATGAFFNDTETSTGNTFAAGDFDLQIDNTSYALDFNIPGYQNPIGAFVANPANSWALKDLVPGVDHFFSFEDLKPGDYSEDTISIHVGSNDAWMCAAAQITRDADESCTEPELADDGTCVATETDGELDDELNFAFWRDDGDNVLEDDEVGSVFLSGPIADIGAGGQIPLADTSDTGPFGDTPIPGDETVYIGKGWCFGTFAAVPVTQDNGSDVGRSPATDVTGFTCDGSGVNNAAQTDSVQGDMQFYAVQARNNPNFLCSRDYTPTWPQVAP